MSWLFSRALVEEYLPAICSDGEPCALLSGMNTPQAYWCHGRTSDTFRPSRYGMTFAPLTDWHGAALLTLLPGAFRAKHSARLLEARTTRKTSGRKCGESWQMSLPGVSLPRTSRKGQLTPQPTTSRRWVSRLTVSRFPRRTWVLTAFGPDFGYLHTPTATGNYCAPSMQKHPCARSFRQVFGRVTPESHEWLMGWPIGWSGLEPLATASVQSWRLAHGSRLRDESKEAA